MRNEYANAAQMACSNGLSALGQATGVPVTAPAEEVLKKTEDLRNRIGDLEMRLRRVADALMGGMPENVASACAPQPAGVLPMLLCIADQSHALVGEAEDQLRRITRALGC